MSLEIVDVPYTGLTETKREIKQELGKDDFLLLLTKQLQYQDPLEPYDNSEFISQMANFSSLEQITNLTSTIEKYLAKGDEDYKIGAVAFLGTNVYAQRSDMTEPLYGKVESVKFVDGEAVFTIEGSEFSLDDIQKVESAW